jgi:hypothetical protein
VGVPSAAVSAYIAAVLLAAVFLAVLAWRIDPLNNSTTAGNDIVTLVVRASPSPSPASSCWPQWP